MTAFSDETGREQAFERFPKLAGWIERLAGTQMDLSLTEWNEFLAELNAALSAAPVSSKTFVRQLVDDPNSASGKSLRDVEVASPVAQEPVAWQLRQCPRVFWTSWRRCSREDYELVQKTGVFGDAPAQSRQLFPSSPPPTPAGLGADEIAQIIATKCFDPRVIDSSGKPFWKKSQWREAQQAANAILALLSRAGGTTNHMKQEKDQ